MKSEILPIEDRYSLIEEKISFGSQELIVYRIADTDALLDELIEKGEEHEDVVDERIPYWAELWPSAIAMGRYLSEHPDLVEGRTVLEIGCGLGLSGMLAHTLGGKVILSDYLPAALELADFNWRKNFAEEPQLLQLDWREVKEDQAADVILAADVAYEERAFDPLIKAFKILMQPNSKLILTEPNRQIAKKFLIMLEESGLYVEKLKREIRYRDITTVVNLYLLEYRS
ncbi:MAG: methyltransferase domain-containing protein [Bacteroidota bacterium]